MAQHGGHALICSHESATIIIVRRTMYMYGSLQRASFKACSNALWQICIDVLHAWSGKSTRKHVRVNWQITRALRLRVTSLFHI
jgi:hypothetical protein